MFQNFEKKQNKNKLTVDKKTKTNKKQTRAGDDCFYLPFKNKIEL